ncbi:MAG: NifU N-terminal domain-containing protein [Pseudomonadota bacterium]|nr:NifU N-terminal domain-containing protein [Pseudomonadota bacterium]
MIRSTLKKLLGQLLGRKTPPPAARPTPPRQPVSRPAAPAPEEEEEDRGHSHSHGHSHDHGGDRAEPAPAPKVAPAPAAVAKPAPAPVAAPKAEDRGHDHGHSHDHGRAEAPAAEPAAEKKVAKKAVEVVAEDTPNPNARKFTTTTTVVEKGSLSFNSAEDAEKHPLGKALWACGGVKGVFAVKDFVTVTKEDSADWAKLSPKVVKAIKKVL